MTFGVVSRLGVSCLLVLALAGCGRGVGVNEAAAKFGDKVEGLIAEEMSRQKIPGLSAAVALGGEVVWIRAFGSSDIESSVPVKSDTVFRIASISKSITATAVAQLAENGKLSLDAPVQTYCPKFPVKPWPVTSRQLLGHLAGVRHYTPVELERPNTYHYTDIITPLDIFRNDPLAHAPGTAFLYTTYGYNVLGCAVEGASGKPFVEYLKENIFSPSGLKATQPDDARAIIPKRAQGYRLDAEGKVVNSDSADTSNKIPGGGLSSTAEDLVRFAIALQKGSLLRPETLNGMWVEQKGSDGKTTDYGLGWILGKRDGLREVWHTGGQERVSTVLYTLPDKQLAIALLCNLEDGRLIKVAQQISDLILGR